MESATPFPARARARKRADADAALVQNLLDIVIEISLKQRRVESARQHEMLDQLMKRIQAASTDDRQPERRGPDVRRKRQGTPRFSAFRRSVLQEGSAVSKESACRLSVAKAGQKFGSASANNFRKPSEATVHQVRKKRLRREQQHEDDRDHAKSNQHTAQNAVDGCGLSCIGCQGLSSITQDFDHLRQRIGEYEKPDAGVAERQ